MASCDHPRCSSLNPGYLTWLIASRLVSLIAVHLVPVPHALFLPAAHADPGIHGSMGRARIQEVDYSLSLDGALGLGDVLTLNSMREPSMLPMARAELILQRHSSDPLVALPHSIRRPFRAVVARFPEEILPARVVVLPVEHQHSEVLLPLLRFASGAVDIYADPVSSPVVAAIERWLSTQDPPPRGHLQPLLLKLVPMRELNTLTLETSAALVTAQVSSPQ
jgi:hypothetical protein